MNTQDFKKLIESYPVQSSFSHFSKAVTPPFITWLNNTENFIADSKVYHSRDTFTVELYTRINTIEEEKKLEAFFNDHELIWQKTNQVWVDEDKVMMSVYEIE